MKQRKQSVSEHKRRERRRRLTLRETHEKHIQDAAAERLLQRGVNDQQLQFKKVLQSTSTSLPAPPPRARLRSEVTVWTERVSDVTETSHNHMASLQMEEKAPNTDVHRVQATAHAAANALTRHRHGASEEACQHAAPQEINHERTTRLIGSDCSPINQLRLTSCCVTTVQSD